MFIESFFRFKNSAKNVEIFVSAHKFEINEAPFRGVYLKFMSTCAFLFNAFLLICPPKKILLNKIGFNECDFKRFLSN